MVEIGSFEIQSTNKIQVLAFIAVDMNTFRI